MELFRIESREISSRESGEIFLFYEYTKFKSSRLAAIDTNGDGVIQPGEFDHSLAGNSTL